MAVEKLNSLGTDIVNYASSIEFMDVFGYLPDPDPIFLKAGLDVQIFDQILGDAHVFACYQSRKAGVLTSEWRIEYPGGTERYSEIFESVMRELPVETIISQVLDAPFYGFSVNEIVWRLTGGKWLPVAVEQKPNDWFVFDYEGNLRFLSKRNQLQGELLPPYKFLVARNFPTYKNPYGIRILSRCFWPVTFKKGGFRFWLGFLEKFGIPWLLGKTPNETPKERREELVSMLSQMVQNAVAVINGDETIEALNVVGKSGGDNMFHDIVDTSNGEISKAILTQTLTTEIGDKGAYAASQSHLSIRQDVCSMDKKLVAAVFNTLFKWICRINFDTALYPYLRWVEEDDAREPHARRDSQLVSQGVRFEPAYYERTYNLRSDEFTVEEPGGRKPKEPDHGDEKSEKRKPVGEETGEEK